VTTGLLQFVLGWFMVLLAFVSGPILVSISSPHEAGLVTSSGLPFAGRLIAIGCAVVVWQYAGRRTTAARLVLIAAVCAGWPGMWLVSHFFPLYKERVLAESPKGV
jgi:hypothetical protein